MRRVDLAVEERVSQDRRTDFRDRLLVGLGACLVVTAPIIMIISGIGQLVSRVVYGSELGFLDAPRYLFGRLDSEPNVPGFILTLVIAITVAKNSDKLIDRKVNDSETGDEVSPEDIAKRAKSGYLLLFCYGLASIMWLISLFNFRTHPLSALLLVLAGIFAVLDVTEIFVNNTSTISRSNVTIARRHRNVILQRIYAVKQAMSTRVAKAITIATLALQLMAAVIVLNEFGFTFFVILIFCWVSLYALTMLAGSYSLISYSEKPGDAVFFQQSLSPC